MSDCSQVRRATQGATRLAPWIDQTTGTFPTAATWVTWAPFMNQIATLPLVSCQRMSLLPGVRCPNRPYPHRRPRAVIFGVAKFDHGRHRVRPLSLPQVSEN
jgi:hypothetical protein